MTQSTQGSVLRREQWMFLFISHLNIQSSRIKRRQIFYRIVCTIFCKQSCHHIPSFPLLYRTISSHWDTRRAFPSPKSGITSALQISTSPGLHNPQTPQILPSSSSEPLNSHPHCLQPLSGTLRISLSGSRRSSNALSTDKQWLMCHQGKRSE